MELNLPALLRLTLVTDERLLGGRDLVEVCLAAERGGVSCVQLRLEEASARDLASAARALLEALSVRLIINSRADVAIAVGAAGVHLGPDDVPVPMVRRIAPRGFLIGAAVGSVPEVDNGRGADYWAIGPWRVDTTQADTGSPLGSAGFTSLIRRAEGRPCIAMGGIRPEEVREVRAAGGVGVAVASGILGLPDPEEAARSYSA